MRRETSAIVTPTLGLSSSTVDIFSSSSVAGGLLVLNFAEVVPDIRFGSCGYGLRVRLRLYLFGSRGLEHVMNKYNTHKLVFVLGHVGTFRSAVNSVCRTVAYQE